MTGSNAIALLESVYKYNRADLEYQVPCFRLSTPILEKKEQAILDMYQGLICLKSHALIGVVDQVEWEMNNLHRSCPELHGILVPFAYREEVLSDHVGQTSIIRLSLPSIIY